MPSTRHEAVLIRSHRPAGRGYYRIVLRAPEAARRARPGQFVMLRVTETLDPILARPFGISSVVSKSDLEIFYRVVGRGTSLLTRAAAGGKLTMLGPLGNGFARPEQGVVPLLVSGGSGFPPLHFLLQRSARAHFFTGARDRDCLPPSSVLKSIRGLSEKLHLATEDGSEGTAGTAVDLLERFLARNAGSARFHIYACGPHAMLAAAARVASAHRSSCSVSMEERMACGLGVCMGCATAVKAGGYKRVCKEGPVFDANDIDWSERIPVAIRHPAMSVRK